MTEASRPAYESEPSDRSTSATTPRAAPPERGRTSTMGSTLAGMPMREVSGARSAARPSMAPEARSIPRATTTATSGGMTRTATWKPSFAPSTKTG
jgi:hypothetical protein